MGSRKETLTLGRAGDFQRNAKAQNHRGPPPGAPPLGPTGIFFIVMETTTLELLSKKNPLSSSPTSFGPETQAPP